MHARRQRSAGGGDQSSRTAIPSQQSDLVLARRGCHQMSPPKCAHMCPLPVCASACFCVVEPWHASWRTCLDGLGQLQWRTKPSFRECCLWFRALSMQACCLCASIVDSLTLLCVCARRC
eukprot:4946478-Alexandrium_andersonii.AAC.1